MIYDLAMCKYAAGEMANSLDPGQAGHGDVANVTTTTLKSPNLVSWR